MELRRVDPPRLFEVGLRGAQIAHVADVDLGDDEQVTFITPSGSEFDVVRKSWGYYATPSLNGRLREHGFRAALCIGVPRDERSSQRLYVLLVEEGREPDFDRYLDAEGMRVAAWLDDDDAVAQAVEGLAAGAIARRHAPAVSLAKLLGPFVYQPDQGLPRGLRKVSTRFNQALAERGYAAPWLWSPERCQAYWASQSSHSSPNHPSTYVAKSPAIVDFLHRFWAPDVGPRSSILELGSNAGPNLNHLQELGYSDLSAVEINPTAIEAMREAFPDLADTARISEGSLEDVVPGLAADSASVVFTMAVLIHIHPSSHHLFGEIVRVARDYVCVIEAETVTLSYIFARNYRRVFEDLGCTQLKSVMISRESLPELANYHGYVARLFSVPGGSHQD